MLHIALLEPEIAPNTGNIARLCAATGTRLHLIGRLGFHLDDRSLRRAGLDYWEHVDVVRHLDWNAFAQKVAGCRLLPFSARGVRSYAALDYQDGDCLLFGSESKGLPAFVLKSCEPPVSIPIFSPKVRSLNLATAAGIALYEALRQVHGWV